MKTVTHALAAVTLLVASPAVAQDHAGHSMPEHGTRAVADGLPEGWLMRLDRESATPDMAEFVVMEPGWHVKTAGAGAGIFWKPEMEVEGRYTASATLHLFNPRGHAEAFGLFVGGDELGDMEQEYLYFLVRQTGEYLIKRRVGDGTEDVVGWTRHSAVPIAAAGEVGPTEYTLAVRAGEREVEFLVNGSVVHTMPRSAVDTDGVVGLRINHMLDLHVETLAIE